MPQAAVTVRRPKPHHPVTTDRRHGYAVVPHVLARQFAVEQPNQVWVEDITSVWTVEGWLCVADGAGTSAALSRTEASFRSRPSICVQASQRLLEAHDLHCRMSRKGDGLGDLTTQANHQGNSSPQRQTDNTLSC
jgi:transposase InsO family protein